jgi:hypothetical protein
MDRFECLYWELSQIYRRAAEVSSIVNSMSTISIGNHRTRPCEASITKCEIKNYKRDGYTMLVSQCSSREALPEPQKMLSIASTQPQFYFPVNF